MLDVKGQGGSGPLANRSALAARTLMETARSLISDVMVAEDVLIRRAEIVRIHLDILEGLIEEPISTSAAIRASVSLRFLSDGALSQLGHDLGQSIAIPAPDLADIEIEQVLTFACGGYVLAGVEICPHYLYRFSGENSPNRAHFERQIKTSPAQHRLVEHRLGSGPIDMRAAI